jgi:hypothetical protein
MKKKNCWEYKKCGREPGGVKVHELGECMAAKEEGLDGVHDGENAGRSCWVIAGTMCGGKVQGTFAQKYGNCVICDFFKQVKEEEAEHFMLSSVLLGKLNKEK